MGVALQSTANWQGATVLEGAAVGPGSCVGVMPCPLQMDLGSPFLDIDLGPYGDLAANLFVPIVD